MRKNDLSRCYFGLDGVRGTITGFSRFCSVFAGNGTKMRCYPLRIEAKVINVRYIEQGAPKTPTGG